jgi:hypothetical protein
MLVAELGFRGLQPIMDKIADASDTRKTEAPQPGYRFAPSHNSRNLKGVS